MTDSNDKLKVYLLCRYAPESSLYNSWTDSLDRDFEVVTECASDWNPPSDCGIVVTHEHYRWEEISSLRRIYEQQQVPILILADGILEYRNTWDNPTIASGAIYQPLVGHKIACIGDNSARMISAWGNEGKVEVVGLPRFDSLVQSYLNSNTHPPGGPKSVLVATATTPAFTDEQRDAVTQSIIDLKTHFNKGILIDGEPVNVVWRLTDGLYEATGIEAPGDDQPDLLSAISTAHAVITTPSTMVLESALLKRPTAILDYSNSPPMIQSGWAISCNIQIEPVVREMFAPPTAKIWYQEYCLADNLRCDPNSAAATIKLIEEMITIAADCRKQKLPLSLPARILSDQSPSPVPPYRAADCYSDLEDVHAEDLTRLQLELSEAKHRLGTVPQELADKNNQISQLQAALDESRRRLADVRARLFKLRKILGIGKENQTEDIAQ